MRRSQLPLASLLLLAACSDDGDRATPDAAEPLEPLETCAPGVWINVCDECFAPACTEDGDPLFTPECSEADCQYCNIWVLRDDGRWTDFQMRRTSDQFSVVGGAVACTWDYFSDTWSVSPDGALVLGERELEAECSRTRLDTPEWGADRADQALSAAVLSAWDAGECLEVRY